MMHLFYFLVYAVVFSVLFGWFLFFCVALGLIFNWPTSANA